MTLPGFLRGLFDPFGLRARLRPALFVLLPVFTTVAVWFPSLYQTAAGLLSVAMACGATVWMAETARNRGRDAEKRLYKEWGGKPTTIWLRHSDDDPSRFDPGTRARVHAYVAQHLSGWTAPTAVEEAANAKAADARYEEAVRWLIEQRRDTKRYALIFEELISFNYRRNLYGIKPVGLAVSCAAAAVNGWLLYRTGTHLDDIEAVYVGALAFCAFVLVAWLTTVTKAWVRDSGDAYARALLSSCLVQGGTVTPPKEPRKRKGQTEAAA